MPFPRRVARRFVPLALVAAVAGVLPATLASGDAGAWDLAHPSVDPTTTNILGAAARGAVFDVTEDTPITALGIDAAFGTDTTLTVEIRTVTGATPGPVVASAEVAVAGGGDVDFHDVQVAFTFVAGTRYDVRFQVPGGWGFGPNTLRYQPWENRRFVNPFAVGPFIVLSGGGAGSQYTYGAALPHLRVVGAAADAQPPSVETRVVPGDAVAETGWYNAASSGADGVTVEVVASDESGVVQLRCTDAGRVVLDVRDRSATTVVLGDGFHSLVCTATDAHGNVGTTDAPVDARVDQTPPALTPRVDPNPVYEGQTAMAVPEAVDAYGIADARCGDVTTRVPGHHTVPCHADDLAGNRTSVVASYDVLYAFDGFFAPVRMGVDNRVRAGASVPLKFSLDGFRGLDVLAGGAPEVRGCDATGAVTPATGSLSYDGDDDVYAYVWKTDKRWADGCYEVTVRLDDGSAKSVRFSVS